MVSLLIYGLSLLTLFLASFLLHGVKASPGLHLWLNRFDHSAIFLLIAGTYTPIVYNLFPSSWRWPLLLLIWTIAVIGTGYKLTSARIHGLLNVSIYVVLGWGGAVPLLLSLELAPVLAAPGLRLLLGGGLIYSTGFVVYYIRRPDPWPATFGHHEIWHLFVIAGSLAHYLFMLRYVVPA
jgi:hemolysin III